MSACALAGQRVHASGLLALTAHVVASCWFCQSRCLPRIPFGIPFVIPFVSLTCLFICPPTGWDRLGTLDTRCCQRLRKLSMTPSLLTATPTPTHVNENDETNTLLDWPKVSAFFRVITPKLRTATTHHYILNWINFRIEEWLALAKITRL
jgi:hypothetical protein